MCKSSGPKVLTSLSELYVSTSFKSSLMLLLFSKVLEAPALSSVSKRLSFFTGFGADAFLPGLNWQRLRRMNNNGGIIIALRRTLYSLCNSDYSVTVADQSINQWITCLAAEKLASEELRHPSFLIGIRSYSMKLFILEERWRGTEVVFLNLSLLLLQRETENPF